MRSVIRRIRRLQRALPPIPQPRLVTEDDRRWAATTAALLRQMDPTHARVVREDLKRADGRGHQLNGLTIAFIACAWHHLRENQPLALPPEVAAIYLSGNGFLTSVSLSAALNRACNAIPTNVAIRIAGYSCPTSASAVANDRAMRWIGYASP